jgi:hypothetical protein
MRPATLFALLLTGCTATHDGAPEPSVEPGGDGHAPAVIPEVSPPDPPAEAPSAAAPQRFPSPSTWVSPACEGRSYERQLAFDGDRFTARDLVAPCPPGTQCVWSGVIDRAGSWSLDRQQLRLLPDADAHPSPQASKFPLPQHLWLAADGTLTEDDGACPYVMAPTP